MNTIPVIDLAPWFAGAPADRAAVGSAVADACTTVGFFKIANHGVPPACLTAAFEAMGAFFDLPAAEKSTVRPADGMAPRGWHALETKNLSRTIGLDTPPDLREQFYIGPPAPDLSRLAAFPDAAPFYQDNLWPDRPAGLRETYTSLYRAMEGLARELMRVFAVALKLDAGYFDSAIDNHFATLPANFYPVPDGDPRPGQLRAGAHSDFGSLTILALNDAPGGLQVLMQDGAWHDVTAGPGEFIINIGDMMQRWTNETWRSTLHRVVNPPASARADSRRMSIGFFLHPNYDAVIEALPGCTGPNNPARHPPIHAGDLMRQKMKARAV
jgi:isopenicillin N synthase-like dioxygenase